MEEARIPRLQAWGSVKAPLKKCDDCLFLIFPDRIVNGRMG